MADGVQDGDFEAVIGIVATGLAVFGFNQLSRRIRNARRGRRTVREHDQSARLAALGAQLVKAGQPAAAVEPLQAALAIQPANALAARGLALALGTMAVDAAQFHAALSVAQHALACSPDPPSRALALDIVGWVHLRSGEFALAVGWLRECLTEIAKVPDEQTVAQLRAAATGRLGLAWAGLKDHHSAFRELSRAAQLNPDNVEALTALAVSAVELRDYDTAAASYLRACQAVRRQPRSFPDPDLLVSTFLTEVGNAYRNAGKGDLAEQAEQAAVDACARNPYAQANRALTAARRGDRSTMHTHLALAMAHADRSDQNFVGQLANIAVELVDGNLILQSMLANRLIGNNQYHQREQSWRTRQDLERIPDRNSLMISNHFHGDGNQVAQGAGSDNIAVDGSTVGMVGGRHQSAAVGPVQGSRTNGLPAELSTLVPQLAALARSLDALATSPIQQQSARAVDEARAAAEQDDRDSVITHLKRAGEWAMKVAGQVNNPMAEAAVRGALGLLG